MAKKKRSAKKAGREIPSLQEQILALITRVSALEYIVRTLTEGIFVSETNLECYTEEMRRALFEESIIDKDSDVVPYESATAGDFYGLAELLRELGYGDEYDMDEDAKVDYSEASEASEGNGETGEAKVGEAKLEVSKGGVQ